MAYESLYDPTNPFNRDGLSREVRTILDYLEAAKRATGLDVVVTSTTDHPVYSASGNRSRHRMPGTGGEGLALDCRMRQRGDLTHRAVFDAFMPVESQLAELIYAGAPYNVKNGKRVPPYAVADHRDHVHVAVGKGVFVRYPDQEDELTPEQEKQLATAAQKSTDGVNYDVDAQQRLVRLEQKVDAILAKLGP